MPDIDLTYEKFRKTDNPVYGRELLSYFESDMKKAIQSAGVQPTPLNMGSAKKVVWDSLYSYDPDQGTKLRSWVQTQLQRVNRDIKNSRFSVKVPEARMAEAKRVRSLINEIEAETGFEPSDQMIMDRLGVNRLALQRSRQMTPEITTYESSYEPVDEDISESDLVRDMVYHSLDNRDQLIMEYMFGYNNNEPRSSEEVAKKLKISPSAISQRAKKIREKLESAGVYLQ